MNRPGLPSVPIRVTHADILRRSLASDWLCVTSSAATRQHLPSLRWPRNVPRRVPVTAAPSYVLRAPRHGADGDLRHHHRSRQRGVRRVLPGVGSGRCTTDCPGSGPQRSRSRSTRSSSSASWRSSSRWSTSGSGGTAGDSRGGEPAEPEPASDEVQAHPEGGNGSAWSGLVEVQRALAARCFWRQPGTELIPGGGRSSSSRSVAEYLGRC